MILFDGNAKGENFECAPSQWDSDYLGVNSAKVNLTGIVSNEGQNEIVNFAENFDFTVIYNQHNVKENNWWIGMKTGAFLADINIQFIKDLRDRPCNMDDNTYVINNMVEDPDVSEIASKTFRHSRFFNDPKLCYEKSQRIYWNWVQDAFNQKDKSFVITKRHGRTAGFILFSNNGIDQSSVIELIAVDIKYQGQDIGKSLIHGLESFLIDRGIRKIKVGTQADNLLAVRFYSKMGFEYLSCKSIYHLWT